MQTKHYFWFCILPYAFFFPSVGIGTCAMSMVFAILPFTDVFVAFGKGKGAHAIRPAYSYPDIPSRTPRTGRQTPALCWGQQQDGKGQQNGCSKFSHGKILTEMQGELKGVFLHLSKTPANPEIVKSRKLMSYMHCL